MAIELDTTEQVLAQARLRDSERLLQEAGAMARLGAWEMDLATHCPVWSEQVYRIHEVPGGTDISLADAVGFYAPEARPVIAACVQRAIDTGEGWDEELPLITAGGRKIWVRATGRPEFRNGKCVRLSGSFQEITERRQAEEAIRMHLARLEAAHAELEVTKQRSEAASQVKSQFLAVMSHEIRTPLNGILGMTHLLMDSGLTASQQEMADTVMRSGESLLEIINDILDFTKIEAGRTDLEQIEFDLEQTLEEVVDLMHSKAREKGLELVYWFDPSLPVRVTGDPGRLRQMALNLVSNAIKFTTAGSVILRTLPGRQKAGAIRIEVEDDGVGIAPEQMPHLFRRFSQADSSTTRKFGGTGLGLAIVKELAELMGGTVDARSCLNVGSTFGFEVPLPATAPDRDIAVLPAAYPRVVLNGQVSRGRQRLLAQLALYRLPDPNLPPITIGDEEWEQPLKGRWLLERITGERQRPHRPAVVPVPPLDSLSTMRILLVEDNIVNQRVGARLIGRLGCRVDVAANGVEAVEMVRQLPYDLIFMDCQMPEMDGFEATRRIRLLPGAAARVPIIALTASASENDRLACLSRGMDGYLSKPTSFAALAGMVHEWAGRLAPAVAGSEAQS